MTEPEPKRDLADSEAEFLVDAIGEQYLDRLQAGESPDREAFVSAVTEIADLLDEHLALVEVLYEARLYPGVGPAPSRGGETGHPEFG